MDITIIKQNIALMHSDCIVNAANEHLRAGGGVCGAIFEAADSDMLQKACDMIGYCAPGDAVITPGCGVPAKYIVHAVGPRRESYSEKTLYSAYRNALLIAEKNGCKTIAFPVISSGIFRVDKTEAWKVGLRACLDYMDEAADPIEITFCVHGDEMKEKGYQVLETMKEERQRKMSAKIEVSKASENTLSKNDFVFFWKTDEENGCFANWYQAPFTIEGISYPTVEHYMMAKKALLFGDLSCYQKIMQATTPKEAKTLGKLVQAFDGKVWDSCKEEIVYHAVYAKCTQNAQLKSKLLATGQATMAEASPLDKIWGIGMAADDADAKLPSKWQGQNLLGRILEKVRDEIK